MNEDGDNEDSTSTSANNVVVDDLVLQEDEILFRVDDDGSPAVNGVKLKRGIPFTNTPISVAFSNVIGGVNFDQFTKEVVGPNQTNVVHLTTQLVALFMLWSPKRKSKERHFFADAYFSQKVISLELHIDFIEFLSVRGWVVKRRTTSDKVLVDIDVYYSRVQDCLTRSFPHAVEKHKQLMAMFDRVYTYLQSTHTYSAISLNEKVVLSENHDSLPKMSKIPTFGNSKLIDICTKQRTTYPSNRYLLEHQHLQLALDTILVSFTPIMLPTRRKCPRYHEQLFGLIFKDCKTRRQLLEGMQAILMYCKDKPTIMERKTTLRAWLETPAEILTLVRRASSTSSVSAQGYGDRVWRSLQLLYAKKSSKDHSYRSPAGQRLVVQFVVYMKLKILDEINSPPTMLPCPPSLSNKKKTRKERLQL